MHRRLQTCTATLELLDLGAGSGLVQQGVGKLHHCRHALVDRGGGPGKGLDVVATGEDRSGAALEFVPGGGTARQ